MSKTLAIIGAGDLGMQIAHYAITDNHYDKVVFFDDYSNDSSKNGYKIIGTTKEVLKSFQRNIFNELIIGIGYKHLEVRKKLFIEFHEQIPFGKIIHSTCWLDKSVKVMAGTVIYPNCTLDAGVSIGYNSILNLACTISHDTTIGSHCFLSPRVAIAGFVDIYDNCILGINSTIIDNIKISTGIQIGGGTVVIKDLLKSGLYVGNPHRYIVKNA